MHVRLVLAMFAVVQACLCGSTPLLPAVRGDDSRTALRPIANDAFAKEIQPLLVKYCNQCHAGAKPKAGLDLDAYKDEAAIRNDRAMWVKILDQLQDEVMPPADKPQPTPAERDAITAWIETRILQVNCSGPIDPGRVTLRRLNRVEYNNTVRDLLGVNFQPADDFPSDDVGYGFDNIGDVLSMPPILLEKYMDAAEKIVDAAIQTNDPARSPKQRVDAARAKSTSGGRYGKSGHVLSSSGTVSAEFDFPKAGEYVIRIRAFGHQAGSEPARMEVRLDKQELKKVDVPAVESNPGIYELPVKADAGKKTVSVAFINDFYNPKDPNPENRDRNLLIEYLEVQGPLGQAAESPSESHRRIFTCQPAGKDGDACARVILRNFVSRAFRRPARDHEVYRLVQLTHAATREGDSFERGIQLAIQAVLVSPHFLFRVEGDPAAGAPQAQPAGNAPGVQPLTDYELASRLSYFLWSSMPDEELFRHAEHGTLRKDGNLEAQVKRMLRDPRSKALVENFAGQWLQLRNLKNVTPDKGQFAEFDDALRTAMKTETELLFQALLTEDRSVLEFLDANFTFVNERLARHYGLSDIKGDEFRRVTLTGSQRGGILGHASVLTVTSNPTRTSPVKRGKWILENILGSSPPPPPPGVPELNEAKAVVESAPLRQRLEQHRANPSCAACHQRMDPLGFGLENYNAIGAWRTMDGSFPIDAGGTLPGGQSFQGPGELKAILKARQKDFVRCLSEKMLTYALGRGVEYYDECVLKQIVAKMAQHQSKFSILILAIVNSDPFQKRRTGT